MSRMQFKSSGGGLGICAELCAADKKKMAGVENWISPTAKSSGLTISLGLGCAVRSEVSGSSHFWCAAISQQDFLTGAQHLQSVF
jgi:hypothetical protein